MRLFHKTFITLTLVSALTMQASSQSMTLRDCLAYARDHSPANRVASLETDEARLDARITSSALMPSLNLSTSGNLSFGRNIDPETNTYDNKKTLSQQFALQMSLPLFDGLVSVNNLKAARAGSRSRSSAEAYQRDRISLSVVKAFYNVSYCKSMVDQMERQLDRDRRNLAATVKGEELGTKSGADTAEMKAIVAADEYELANQQSLLSKAYLALRSEMGMELTADPLALVEDTASNDAVAPDPAFIHPRVAEAEQSVTQGLYLLRSAKGGYSPRIYMSAGISTSYYRMMGSEVITPDFSRQWSDNMGQYIGFSVTIPLFDGLSTVNRVKRAGVELRRRQALLDQARYEISREEAEAELDRSNAVTEHEAARARLDAELTAFNAVQRKFELGSVSAIDFYTASAKLAAARAALEGKRIQRIISGILVDYYRGIPFIKEI